ncbi:gamma-glutamyl-CDP-amidate hydrolase [Helicobacter burdigaliensis]|uniref:gamma-glutamyl-CDP-amidate hydrolase n=1 Tax=Helicobacter burdigaliensis TaxID=2315334 RepID=UPI000EF74F64|nr:gamma-glutamyl-CDP-amidate hydrolase [Helicobacter burdigaliensis]
MSLKFIGITQRLLQNESYYELREALALEWGEFFSKNLKGFLMLPLSYEIDFEDYKDFLSGVILSGGNDLNSLNPNPLSQKRDLYEAKIIEACKKINMPLLGICRGAQILGGHFGAKLEKGEGHVGEHFVKTTQNKIYKVNSFHNYCIMALKEELVAHSYAEDKSVESFYHKALPFFGIMWHIEREGGMENQEIFTKWLQAVKNFKGE